MSEQTLETNVTNDPQTQEVSIESNVETNASEQAELENFLSEGDTNSTDATEIEDWDDIPETNNEEVALEGEKETNLEESREKSPSSENKDEQDNEKRIEADSKDKDSTDEEPKGEPSLEEKISSGDLVIKAKVDGEEVDVSLKELKANYSGKVAWDKKFTEIDKKEKLYKDDIKAVNNYINEFGKKMQEKDAVSAMQYLGNFANIPPHAIKEMLIEQLLPEITRRTQMNDYEIKAEQLAEENKFLQEQKESELKRREIEQSDQELNLKIAEMRETHNIESEEWSEAVNFLETQKLNQEITPELISEYVVHDRAYQRADNLLDQVDGKLKEDENFVNELQSIIVRDSSLSDEDVISMIREATGINTKEAETQLTDKIAKKEKIVPKEEPKVKNLVEEEEILDWDDL